MPRLRVAPRWLREPLWIISDEGGAEAVDMDGLDLSEDLADRMDAWIDAFDAIYDAADLSSSAFPDAATQRHWRSEGDAIVAALREELGPDWDVELALQERP